MYTAGARRQAESNGDLRLPVRRRRHGGKYRQDLQDFEDCFSDPIIATIPLILSKVSGSGDLGRDRPRTDGAQIAP